MTYRDNFLKLITEYQNYGISSVRKEEEFLRKIRRWQGLEKTWWKKVLNFLFPMGIEQTLADWEEAHTKKLTYYRSRCERWLLINTDVSDDDLYEITQDMLYDLKAEIYGVL